jgi:two-component system C4-dicarboxylate transport sensor histidine kinase DctB
MQSRAAIERQFRRFRFGLFLVWAVVLALIVAWSVRSARERALSEVMQKAGETLSVQTEILSGVLDKYRLLPPLLSRQSSIRALFVRDAEGNAQAVDARRIAESTASMSAAMDVAFFFPDGELLANARGSFIDRAEGLPELIEVALQGRLGRAAVANSQGERTYAFSSGVRREGKFVGVVIVYVDFYRVEAAWALSARRIFVTDKEGTVFLANDPAWRLKNISNLREAAESDRYLIDGRFEPRMDLVRGLPLLEWDLHVLADPAPVAAARLSAASIATLVGLLAGMIALVVLRRSEEAIIKARTDRATALRLERVVRDRTRALSITNQSLSQEVEVRREAEERLRKTQKELVQTAKLAALGQMSTALSHEYNQPLAAIRSYADNALRFLDKGALSEVSGNLARINGLVERMAELSRTLLSFSRKPGASIGRFRLARLSTKLYCWRARGQGQRVSPIFASVIACRGFLSLVAGSGSGRSSSISSTMRSMPLPGKRTREWRLTRDGKETALWSPSLTMAPGSSPHSCPRFSSLSSPPRGSVRGLVSACPSLTTSSVILAEPSWWTTDRKAGPVSRSLCRQRNLTWPE